MPCNHNDALVRSPGSGNVWLNVHDSTSRSLPPSSTFEVIFASRFVVQNVGATFVSHGPLSHFMSTGTSGKSAAVAMLHLLPGTHRSAVSKTSCAGAAPAM